LRAVRLDANAKPRPRFSGGLFGCSSRMNGKPSSPVLRGLGASNGARLLDPWDYFRFAEIREEFSTRVSREFPEPDLCHEFRALHVGAERFIRMWDDQIRVCRIPIRVSVQQASAGIADGFAKLRSADRRGTGGNSAGPSSRPSSRRKEPVQVSP